MKETLSTFTDFVKSLMQPALTMVAIILLFVMSANGSFPAGDVFKVVVLIILFWFGHTGIKNFTFTGNGKSSGSTETTGTPPKAYSGTSTAAVGDVAATPVPWGFEDNRPSTADQEVVAQQQVGLAVFDRAKFDARVIEVANSNVTWSDRSPLSLYNAAVTAEWGISPANTQVSFDLNEAIIDYAEKAFMQLFDLDAAKWTPQSYMTYLNTPRKDCNEPCKPPVTEGKKTLIFRLTNYYMRRAELESALES